MISIVLKNNQIFFCLFVFPFFSGGKRKGKGKKKRKEKEEEESKRVTGLEGRREEKRGRGGKGGEGGEGGEGEECGECGEENKGGGGKERKRFLSPLASQAQCQCAMHPSRNGSAKQRERERERERERGNRMLKRRGEKVRLLMLGFAGRRLFRFQSLSFFFSLSLSVIQNQASIHDSCDYEKGSECSSYT
jgi:hypothetical protein